MVGSAAGWRTLALVPREGRWGRQLFRDSCSEVAVPATLGVQSAPRGCRSTAQTKPVLSRGTMSLIFHFGVFFFLLPGKLVGWMWWWLSRCFLACVGLASLLARALAAEARRSAQHTRMHGGELGHGSTPSPS